ncbi:response regulator, partial [Pseudomonas protegens]|uniref:response regulator n=1 Tax=Pseudomonas protegens TaxID=380021 RepID=UPI001FF0DB1E
IQVNQLDPRMRMPNCDKELTANLESPAQPLGRVTVKVRCEGASPWTVFVPAQVKLFREVVTRCLQTVGVEVVALNDGRQALDYLRKLVDEGKKPEEEFLMMISDIEMPEMDGYTLTAEIRNDPRMQKLHIILHTSLSGVFNQAMVKKVGADDFLAKFRPDDLASRVVDRIKAADHS